MIRENGGGIGLNFSLEVDVRDNRIVENTGYGLHAVRAGNSVFENNVVARNGLDGFSLDNTNATIQGNTFRRNGGTGLWIIERVCSAIASYGLEAMKPTPTALLVSTSTRTPLPVPPAKIRRPSSSPTEGETSRRKMAIPASAST